MKDIKNYNIKKALIEEIVKVKKDKNTGGWDEGIRSSEIFLVLATKNYFKDAICTCQALYAKELKKPFFILLKKGVEIPVDFLDGVESYKIEVWEYSEDISGALDKLLSANEV